MKNLKIILIIYVFFITSCEKENEIENEVEEFDQEFAVALTGNSQWPVVVNHENGEHLAIKLNTNTNSIEAISYIYQGLKVYVELTSEGIPTVGYANDHLLVFENYEGNFIDMGIITPEGETHLFRDLEIDQNEISQIEFSNHKAPNNNDLTNALKAGGIGVGIMGCAFGAAAAVTTGGVAIPLAILGCGSAITSTIASIADLSLELEAGAIGFGLYANAIGCVGGGPSGVASCISFFLDVSTTLTESYSNQMNENSSEFGITQAALTYGHGAIQVTLTWDNSADIDLHVTDPVGETIYYGNPSSASGGQLDVDDIDGNGPENIFWPAGTVLSGNYIVDVNHYGGESPTNFTVMVQIFGETEIFTGTIHSEQTLKITSFTRSHIQKEKIQIIGKRIGEPKS